MFKSVVILQKVFIHNDRLYHKRNLLIMEKLKIVIILLGLIWFSGCGYIKQTNIESKDIAFSEEETTSIQSDYENYIGTWSEEGKSHESIIYEGGTEFSVEITSDNELNGYLYSQQEISGRFAEIDIICRIGRWGVLLSFFR